MGNACVCEDKQSRSGGKEAGPEAPRNEAGNSSARSSQGKTPNSPLRVPAQDGEVEHLASPAVLDLVKEVCDTSVLTDIPVDCALGHFMEILDAKKGQTNPKTNQPYNHNLLTRDEFRDAYLKLLQMEDKELIGKSITRKEHGTEIEPITIDRAKMQADMKEEMITRVYDCLDKDGNGVIDRMELCAGLAIICKGTAEEKIAAVFVAFDADKSGTISRTEMFDFLYSVFVTVMTPEVVAKIEEESGLSALTAEQLAGATTDDAFAKFDEDLDGTLNISEFTEWYKTKQADNLVQKMGGILQEIPGSFSGKHEG